MMDLNYAHPARGSSGKKDIDEKMHSSGKKLVKVPLGVSPGNNNPGGFMDIMNQYSIPEADEDNYKSQA